MMANSLRNFQQQMGNPFASVALGSSPSGAHDNFVVSTNGAFSRSPDREGRHDVEGLQIHDLRLPVVSKEGLSTMSSRKLSPRQQSERRLKSMMDQLACGDTEAISAHVDENGEYDGAPIADAILDAVHADSSLWRNALEVIHSLELNSDDGIPLCRESDQPGLNAIVINAIADNSGLCHEFIEEATIMMCDPSAELRCAVAECVSRMGYCEELVPLLLGATNDCSEIVRNAAGEGIAQDTSWCDGLRSRLEPILSWHEDPRVRQHAAEALANVGGRSLFDVDSYLCAMARHENDPGVRSAIARSRKRIKVRLSQLEPDKE